MNFYNNTEIQLKSNNKISNYRNRLLRLSLLKHTNTQRHTKRNNNKIIILIIIIIIIIIIKIIIIMIIIIIKRQYQPPSPRKKHPYNTPVGGLHSNRQGIGAVNCYRKDLHPRGCRNARSISFLCKCNLTKC